jgi:hypothetical protein
LALHILDRRSTLLGRWRSTLLGRRRSALPGRRHGALRIYDRWSTLLRLKIGRIRLKGSLVASTIEQHRRERPR